MITNSIILYYKRKHFAFSNIIEYIKWLKEQKRFISYETDQNENCPSSVRTLLNAVFHIPRILWSCGSLMHYTASIPPSRSQESIEGAQRSLFQGKLNDFLLPSVVFTVLMGMFPVVEADKDRAESGASAEEVFNPKMM